MLQHPVSQGALTKHLLDARYCRQASEPHTVITAKSKGVGRTAEWTRGSLVGAEGTLGRSGETGSDVNRAGIRREGTPDQSSKCKGSETEAFQLPQPCSPSPRPTLPVPPPTTVCRNPAHHPLHPRPGPIVPPANALPHRPGCRGRFTLEAPGVVYPRVSLVMCLPVIHSLTESWCCDLSLVSGTQHGTWPSSLRQTWPPLGQPSWCPPLEPVPTGPSAAWHPRSADGEGTLPWCPLAPWVRERHVQRTRFPGLRNVRGGDRDLQTVTSVSWFAPSFCVDDRLRAW